MPPCSGQSRPSPPGGREDAASLDRPCARRLRELAVGMEEYSRRGSNQRMRPKRARKPTISNRWFSGNFSLALTNGGAYVADRVKYRDEPVRIEHALLAIIGAIVPDRLREVLADADDGLAARFLYVSPEPTPIARLINRGDDDAGKRREK